MAEAVSPSRHHYLLALWLYCPGLQFNSLASAATDDNRKPAIFYLLSQ